MLEASHHSQCPKRNDDIRRGQYNYSQPQTQTTVPNKLTPVNIHTYKSRAVFAVPNTDISIVHIDPKYRQDVVGAHGYIALNKDLVIDNSKYSSTDNNKEDAPVERVVPVGEEFSEYTVRELEGLHNEVRQWKRDFRRMYKRFPLNGDITADVRINEKVERVRAIEVLQMEAVRFGGKGAKPCNSNSNNNNKDGVRISDIRPGQRSRDGMASGLGAGTGTSKYYDVSQEFYYPKGDLVSDKIFFKYDGGCDYSTRTKGEYDYVWEEYEINDAAGIAREATVTKTNKNINNNNENEPDPLLAYEPKSAVLDAIRKAIETPIKQFGHVSGDETVEGEYGPEVVTQYITFREAAFRNAELYGDDWEKGIVYDDDSEEEEDDNNANRRDETIHDDFLTTTNNNFDCNTSLNTNSSPCIDTIQTPLLNGDSVRYPYSTSNARSYTVPSSCDYDVTNLKEMRRRRRQLAQHLNIWKDKYMSENGRYPSINDINNDIVISSIYKEWCKLKKEMRSLDTKNKTVGADSPVIVVSHHDMCERRNTPESSDMSRADIKKRIKEIVRKLDTWKAQFAIDFNREPTEEDIHKDNYISSAFHEFIDLKRKE